MHYKLNKALWTHYGAHFVASICVASRRVAFAYRLRNASQRDARACAAGAVALEVRLKNAHLSTQLYTHLLNTMHAVNLFKRATTTYKLDKPTLLRHIWLYSYSNHWNQNERTFICSISHRVSTPYNMGCDSCNQLVYIFRALSVHPCLVTNN